MLTYPYNSEGIEQKISHIVMSAPLVNHAKLDHDIDALGHQLDVPGFKKDIWAIIKADRFLTDEEIRFRICDLVSRICSDLAAMANDPPRILCPVPTSKGVTMYTCGRCAWVFRVEGDDTAAGQAGFDAHRCEDFPREEIDQ